MVERKILVTSAEGRSSGQLRPLRLTTAAGIARRAQMSVTHVRTKLREKGAPDPLPVDGGQQHVYDEYEVLAWWGVLPPADPDGEPEQCS